MERRDEPQEVRPGRTLFTFSRDEVAEALLAYVQERLAFKAEYSEVAVWFPHGHTDRDRDIVTLALMHAEQTCRYCGRPRSEGHAADCASPSAVFGRK